MRRWALVALVATACSTAQPDPGWLAALETYRAERLERLQAADGWLTLVALHWLEPGTTRFGPDPRADLVLPAVEGELHYVDGEVRLDGPEPRMLWSDGEAPVVRVGRLSFVVLERDGRLALRVKDPESPTRLEFAGLDYFEADPAFRVEARFEPYDEPREVDVPTAAGTTSRMLMPGTVEFRLGGESISLQAFVEELGDDELFLIFRDATSGKESYAAARYLYAARDGERVDLDFNRAYNPPCAFTTFATCPLPPRQNWMSIPIRAGERRYESAESHQ